MKLCFIADATSIHIINWLKYFVERGHRVFLITDTENTLQGAQVHLIGDCLPFFNIPVLSASLQIYRKIKKIKQLIRKIQPDIVHAHYATNYGFLAAKTGFHPLLVTCHGSDLLLDPDKDMINRYFVKFALRNSDIITLPSQQMAEMAIGLTQKSKNISILQYGIDTNLFQFRQRTMSSKTTFISSRALLPKYRIDLLIQAFYKLSLDYPDIELIIVGKGPQEVGLKKLAIDLKICDKVFFAGEKTNFEMNNYYHQAEFYVTTSPTDGLSVSLQEALACGCFPILPDNDSNLEVEKQGFQVELYRTNEIDSLYFKMKKSLERKSNLIYMVENNAKLVRQYYSRETNLAKIERLYQKLTGGF
ncbi:MAG: glycosyltransferase [Candidatus Marinimicrobia bacterium]|nr:glycosyltransferase [Candidatus Neomarinimicrobiota bacterium]